MPEEKVLVVDDELPVISLLQLWLQEEGYQVFGATKGHDALRLYFQHKPALSTIDLSMPGMSGFELIQRIREISDGHLLVVSGLCSEENMVRGLDLGADEFMVKPVTKRLFQARVRSLLRRVAPVEDSPTGYYDSSLEMSFLTHEVKARGETVYLRPTEFRLLSCLVLNRDRIVGHSELLDRVWGAQGGSLDSLAWYVSALRGKIEEDQKHPRLIMTVPRVGYRYITQ